jgi:hypothetical protein
MPILSIEERNLRMAQKLADWDPKASQCWSVSVYATQVLPEEGGGK